MAVHTICPLTLDFEVWVLVGPHPYGAGEAIFEVTVKLHFLDLDNDDEPPVAGAAAVHGALCEGRES